jgi:cytochrome c
MEAIDPKNAVTLALRAAWLFAVFLAAPALAAGDIQRGAQVYRACAACHTLEAERHLTGPSLAGLWGRKAGALASFLRYSPGLKKSGIVWNAKTLDAWLSNPEAAVPGNYMGFEGIRDERPRSDLIAFLQFASEGKASGAARSPALADLKNAREAQAIREIRHCRDTYFVTNGRGEMQPLWEFNLRFKTDSSASGPAPGKPVLVGAGMQGDRVQVVFARPDEISAFIREGC